MYVCLVSSIIPYIPYVHKPSRNVVVSSSQRRGGTEGHIYVQYSTGKRVGKETVSVLYPVLYEAHFLFWRDLSEDEGGPSGAGAGSGYPGNPNFFPILVQGDDAVLWLVL